MNWFSASSLWYTQLTSGCCSRSPTKANVFMLRRQSDAWLLDSSSRFSSTDQFDRRSTHPGFTCGGWCEFTCAARQNTYAAACVHTYGDASLKHCGGRRGVRDEG